MDGLYKVDQIAGKGFGLIALRKIKPGTIIFKEKPQFVPKDYAPLEAQRLSKSLMNAFSAMCQKDQEEFLELPNKYLDPKFIHDEKPEWYFTWKDYAESQKHFDGKLLLKIICIHSTNSSENNYTSPVGIRVSRINHSCCPNSHLGRKEDGEIEVVANSKISEGQEISICFLGYNEFMKNVKERQKYFLWNGFICSCEICQREELKNDDETYEQFQNLKKEIENSYDTTLVMGDKSLSIEQKLDRIQKAIFCRTKMYTLAKSKKATKITILNQILENAFLDALAGYTVAKVRVFLAEKKPPYVEEKSHEDIEGLFFGKMEYFKQECDKLSKAAHQMSKMCYGKEHDMFKEWKERNQDFENWHNNVLRSLKNEL